MNHVVSADQLSLVLERLGDGIILSDRDGNCLYVNPEALLLLGRKEEELLGKHLREAMPGAVGQVFEGARGRLLAGDEVVLLRSHFARGRWFEVLGRPLAGNFLIHFHDITGRLQAESARRQIDERFRILLDGVKEYALILLDPKGQVASWNAGAERILGYPAAEALGKPLDFLFPPELVQQGVPQRRLKETVERGSLTVERQATRRDGSRFFAQGTYTALSDELGAPSGFALVIHDITEQRALEESLRTNEERLRLAVEAGAIGTWEEIIGERRIIANRHFL